MSLDLNEKVTLELTRQEGAVLLIALGYVPDKSPRVVEIVDELCARVQRDVSPVGVFVRALKILNEGSVNART